MQQSTNNKMEFRFRGFKVYQSAKILHTKVVKITNTFKREFDYITNQIRRSSLSPILNIAEGSAKKSDKDFNRYLENAMGSVNETVACLEVAVDLGLIDVKTFKELESEYAQVVNQLGGFSKKLKSG